MNIFKRIWQVFEIAEEIDKTQQKRISEVGKILDDFYKKDGWEKNYYDNIESLSSSKDTEKVKI